MLVQEIPPGQEYLSDLEDLGLYHFKGLFPGVSQKAKEKETFHSSILATKNNEYKMETKAIK